MKPVTIISSLRILISGSALHIDVNNPPALLLLCSVILSISIKAMRLAIVGADAVSGELKRLVMTTYSLGDGSCIRGAFFVLNTS